MRIHNDSQWVKPETQPNSCAVTKYLPKENCRPAEIVKWGWGASRPKESSPPAIFSIFCEKHHLSMNPKMAPSKRLGQPCGLGDQYQGHFPTRHPPPLFPEEIPDICYSAWIGRYALPPEDF